MTTWHFEPREVKIINPIPSGLREELIEAGQIACHIGDRTNRIGPEYRAAHARVEKAIAAILEYGVPS